MICSAPVLFPWDHDAYQNGVWDMHPEYRDALAQREAKEQPEP
jgi:hypothetical protein